MEAKEKTTFKKISNFLIGLIFENKKVLFGFILILIGILLLAFFWEIVATNREDLKKNFESYKTGDTLIFHGKITHIFYIENNEQTSIYLDYPTGNSFEVYGDVTNDFKKGDDIFVFVKITKKNGAMTMQPINKTEIYPSYIVDIWFYLILLIGIVIVLYNSKKLKSLLKRDEQIQPKTEPIQQKPIVQPQNIQIIQQKQQISQTTPIKQEIQKPIEKKLIQEKTAKEILQEMREHIEKEKPKKKSKKK